MRRLDFCLKYILSHSRANSCEISRTVVGEKGNSYQLILYNFQ